MEPIEEQIIAKAIELTEALKDSAYTRKEEDKKRVSHLQMELIALCQTFASA